MNSKYTSNMSWVLVVIIFFTLTLVYGVWYSFSVFFVSLLGEFGWSRSVISGAFSLMMIFYSVAGPFAGILVNRLGPKVTIVLGSLILGIGLVLCSFTQTWWQFYIFFGVITAVGIATAGWIPSTTIIQDWFKVKRGLPMGIISSGIGVAMLVFVPLSQFLIIRLGWRIAYRIMALFVPLIIASLAISFLKKFPGTTLFHNVEAAVFPRETKDSPIINRAWNSRSWTIRQAITTKQFWLVGLSFSSGAIVIHSILTHHVAFFVDQGFDRLLASSIAGILGFVSIGGKVLSGYVSDTIGREVTYTIGMICLIVGLGFLITLDIFSYQSSPYYYAFFFGIGYAVTAALPPLIAADFFAGQTYGSIFGTLMILNGIGGSLGAWFAGLLYDKAQSYIPTFIIMMCFALLACLSIWLAAPRKIKMGLKGKCQNSTDILPH